MIVIHSLYILNEVVTNFGTHLLTNDSQNWHISKKTFTYKRVVKNIEVYLKFYHNPTKYQQETSDNSFFCAR